MISIYDKTGTLILSTEYQEDSERKRTLMGDNYVRLVFEYHTAGTPITIPEGAYITFEGQTFTLLSKYVPTYDGVWHYDVTFDAVDGWLRKFIIFFRTSKDSLTKDAVFSLTTNLKSFVDVVLYDIQTELNDVNWERGTILADTDDKVKTLSFKGETLFDALSMIAEAYDTEWWVSESGGKKYINVAKCESGTTVTLTNLTNCTLERQKGDDSEYGTRFWVFGGTQNIPSSYRTGGTSVANIYAERRLRAKNDGSYVDYVEKSGISTEERIDKLVFFDDIYPKNEDKVTEVTTREVTESGMTYTQYTVKAENTPFSGKQSDILDELKLTFQTGMLSGQEFDVSITTVTTGTFDKKFTLVRKNIGTEESPVYIPNISLFPAVGDIFILTGIILPDERVTAAESLLYTTALEYAQKHWSDIDIYRCTADPVYFATQELCFEIGQKVTIANMDGTSRTRDSRIQEYVYPLSNKYAAEYQVGDNSKYSKLANIEDTVSDTTNNLRVVGAEGLRIGDVKLVYDVEKQALKFEYLNDDPARLNAGAVTVGPLIIGDFKLEQEIVTDSDGTETARRLKISRLTSGEDADVYTTGGLSAYGLGDSESSGVNHLYQLEDVLHSGTNILRADGTAKQDGDALVYNSNQGKWVAGAAGGSGTVQGAVLNGTTINPDASGLLQLGTLITSHQTVTLESGTSNGTLKLTTAAGTVDNIAVKGLGSLAYKSDVVSALGYTPYNSTNPNGYITSSGSCNYATSAGNASTLGNHSASYFATADHTHSGYLSTSGGTVNGAITFGRNDSYGIFTSTNNYCCIGTSSKAFYRAYINTVYGDLSGNATTATTATTATKATRLATARTIWGQSFDGTGNVSGALSGVTTGAFSSSVTVGGTLGVTGKTTLAALDASGTVALSSTLTVTGATTINNKLTVNGDGYVNGSVGIGVASPVQKLDVLGKLRLRYNSSTYVDIEVDSSGNLKINGNVYATGGVSAYGNS